MTMANMYKLDQDVLYSRLVNHLVKEMKVDLGLPSRQHSSINENVRLASMTTSGIYKFHLDAVVNSPSIMYILPMIQVREHTTITLMGSLM